VRALRSDTKQCKGRYKGSAKADTKADKVQVRSKGKIALSIREQAPLKQGLKPSWNIGKLMAYLGAWEKHEPDPDSYFSVRKFQ
jgi:hypothetical protein